MGFTYKMTRCSSCGRRIGSDGGMTVRHGPYERATCGERHCVSIAKANMEYLCGDRPFSALVWSD